jgi:hypothetical protein
VLRYLKRHHVGVVALLVVLCGAAYAATSLSASDAGKQPSPALDASRRGRGPGARASWRYPAILSRIASAHETVVGEKIVTVAANRPWIDTGVSIAPPAHLWIDTRADGRWTGNPRFFPYSDANGLPVYPGQYRVDARAAVLSLIGFVGKGSPPTPSEVLVMRSASPGGPGGITNPGFVEVGNRLLDFTPKAGGEVWLRNNDNTNYISDVGRQIVRVIITVKSA